MLAAVRFAYQASLGQKGSKSGRFQLAKAPTVFYENMPSRREHGISCRAVGILMGNRETHHRLYAKHSKTAVSKRISLAGTPTAVFRRIPAGGRNNKGCLAY
jgi:hypothetical protein